jgi:DNA-binding transcriptional LysR family regulator
MMRTTRRLRLTEAGAAFLRKAETAINSLRIAQEEASQSQNTPTATLRITAPGNTVSHVIMKAVTEYRRKYPQVKILLDFSDRRIDLISEGLDIAFRPRLLPDSNLVDERAEFWWLHQATSRPSLHCNIPRIYEAIAA